MPNALFVISPYWHHGTWVFDDPARDLRQEPFVAGVPAMIDQLVAGLPNARKGFRLIFSDQPFPGYQRAFTLTRGEYSGSWYRCDDPPMEGWLCPALFKYFDEAPKTLYAKAEPLAGAEGDA